MRILPRALLVLLGIVLVLWLFRAPLYRSMVNYKIIGECQVLPTRIVTPEAPPDLDAAVNALLDTTAARLHFSTGHVSNDPEELVAGSPANCIGYSALFCAMLRDHLEKAGLAERYRVDAVKSKLRLGDMDVHVLFRSPFWKDHDIVRIIDTDTHERILLDPTFYDAVGIGRVSPGRE